MFDWLIAIPPILVVLLVAGIVTLESLGLPLPGESVLIAAVLLSLGGTGVDPWLLAAAAAVGAIVGDSLGYYIGKRWGARLLRYLSQRYPKYFGVARINAAVGLMQKWGAYAVFFGRFVALLRVFAGPLAGAMAMPYGRFLLANALGGGLTRLVYPDPKSPHPDTWQFAISTVFNATADTLRSGFADGRPVKR